MSKSRHHRRSNMQRRGVKNGSQHVSKHGSKMAPKWLQNGSLKASGRPLGALGLALDFIVLAGPGEGPGGALGDHFGDFFAVELAGTKKRHQKCQ